MGKYQINEGIRRVNRKVPAADFGIVAFTDHQWIKEDGNAPNTPLDNVVLNRLKQFMAMNKFKRVALKVKQKRSHVFCYASLDTIITV